MSSGTNPAAENVDQNVFRDVIGRFASGVTIITTRSFERDFGTTASAVSSLSMDPPMLLVCLNKTSETRGAVAEAGCFAVNILGEAQADLAYAFAKKSPDKFRDAKVARGRNDVPLIEGALARIECTVAETATGGTHTVFLGEVEDASAIEGEPLTYYRGRFGRFEDALQDEAYRRLRELIVHRDLPRGEPLDVERLARELDLEQAHVFYALTRLTVDRLVERRHDGRLVVKALDVRVAHEAVDARCAIEVAVVDKIAGHLDEADAAILRAHARAAQAAAKATPTDIGGLTDAGHAFHAHFIGLLDNEALLGFFRRLDFQTIWRRAAPIIDRRGKVSATYLLDLVEACEAGEADRATAVLYEHAATVKENAREAIEGLGGEI